MTWDLGDGTTVSCEGPGTEWASALGTGDSPTCGHRYTRPGHFTISTTTPWEVEWQGAGDSGTLTLDLIGTRDLTVVELHALVTG